MKKLPLLFVAAVSVLFAFVSCEDDSQPDGAAIHIDIVNSEGATIADVGKCLPDIEVSLRNDTKSDGTIQEKKTSSWGNVYFYFNAERPYQDDIIVTEEEIEGLLSLADTDWYVIINDPKSSSYNASYETKEIKFGKDVSRYQNVYLPTKD